MKRPLMPIPTRKWGKRKRAENAEAIQRNIQTHTDMGGGASARYKLFIQSQKLRKLKKLHYAKQKSILASTSLINLIGKNIS